MVELKRKYRLFELYRAEKMPRAKNWYRNARKTVSVVAPRFVRGTLGLVRFNFHDLIRPDYLNRIVGGRHERRDRT
jgi:hypothetical protein